MLQSPLVDIKTKAKKHRYRLAGTYMKHLVPIENLKGANDIIEHAMQSTAIYVAEQLLEQECLLLPAVKEKYYSVMSTLTCRQNQHVEDTVTARWLLSNLVVCLHHHLSYTCSVRKHGTLLYRSNGDLSFISHLLYKSTHMSRNDEVKAQMGTCTVSSTTEPCKLNELNSLLHKEIRRFLATDLNTPYPFHALNIERLVSEIYPTLWAFIKYITRTISETHGYSTKANQPQTLQHHVKQVRRLFCLSALMLLPVDKKTLQEL